MYLGEALKVLGKLHVKVEYGTQHATLPLYVVAGDGPSLLGRQWLKTIRLDWKAIGLHMISSQSNLKMLLDRYQVFRDELGTMNTIRADFKIKENATPKFHRARTLPFALKEPVEQELRLEEAGILKRVTHSEWAAPVVCVPKKDGHVRLCGDYKVSINSYLDIDQYPLLKEADVFATLANGKPSRSWTFRRPISKCFSVMNQVHYHQHSPRSIPVHKIALRQCIRPCYLPKGYGSNPTWNSWSHLLYR
jgi:hypothetical protein